MSFQITNDILTLSDFNPSSTSVAIGQNSGVGLNSVSIGLNAGQTNQGNYAVAVGNLAGAYYQTFTSGNGVAIGVNAGQTNQGQHGIAIGAGAGSLYQSIRTIAIGRDSGKFTQGISGIAIGFETARTSQQENGIAFGRNTGDLVQGTNSIAIGAFSGRYSQGNNSVCLGTLSAQNSQGASSIAIGYQSGLNLQGTQSVSVGESSAQTNQGIQCVAIGLLSAQLTQGNYSVAIGAYSGQRSQGSNSIAIGNQACRNNQGINAIAIGNNAGFNSQGDNSIAIGNFAGQTTQFPNSIVLNASATAISDLTYSTQSGFYVEPVRGNAAGSGGVSYNSTTKELTYNTAKSFIIDHPIDSNRYLVHACLEGPEAGVYYRGKSEITNDDSVEILLPEYVRTFSEFTVQITPLCNGSHNIITYGSSDVVDGKFTVYGKNGKFFWIVHALRQSIITEPLKEETEVRGDGPYKYIVN